MPGLRWLTREEAALYLRVSPNTLDKLPIRPNLIQVPGSSRKLPRYDCRELDAYMSKLPREGEPECDADSTTSPSPKSEPR